MTQIATTIEQSKRLLAAGLSAESADMWWTVIQPLKQDGYYKLIPDREPYSMLSLYKGEHIALASFEDIPAWSLSRLLDIHGGYNCGIVYDSQSLIEAMVKSICFLITMGDIDKKYLENDARRKERGHGLHQRPL